MDISKVLSELRQELENLNAAIWTLERLQENGPRRRGRPPKAVANLNLSEPEPAAAEEPEPIPAKQPKTARRRR